MLAFVLMLLALAGGVAVTFFIMDAPRRRGVEQQRRLSQELEEVRLDRNEVDARSQRLTEQVRDLRAADAALARRTTEFDRRALTYNDLANENRLLKVDLRNMNLLLARAEAQAGTGDSTRVALSRQREDLGHAYLEEIRSATLKGLTATNYSASKRRIEAAIAHLADAGMRPTEAGQKALMVELQARYEIAVRASVEKEEQSRIREQIRDEQRLEREAQAAIARAEHERLAIQAALNQALQQIGGVHAAEVERLRAQLAEAEANSARAISNAQITKSGHVYVISNTGSFGSDVFKIGMTRRSKPEDRVDELSSASVPFPFDIHMMIPSDDAPKLEKMLHRAFHKRRINRANMRKEFFRVSIDEVVVAAQKYKADVEYRADAEALEYLQSQTMTDDDLEEVEEAYEAAEDEAVLPTDY